MQKETSRAYFIPKTLLGHLTRKIFPDSYQWLPPFYVFNSPLGTEHLILPLLVYMSTFF